MKPAVLQLIDSFRQGGSERQAVQLARLLKVSGRFRVHVACLDASGPLRDEVDGLNPGDIPEYRLTNFRNPQTLAQVWRFARYLKRMNIAVVHTHDFYTNIFGMFGAALAGVPARIASRRESAKRAPGKRRLERAAYRLAHRVVANCEEVRRQLIAEGVSEQKILTSYNGLDIERINPGQVYRRDEVLALLGLSGLGERPIITIVANIRAVKDHATFLRAARRVRDRKPQTAFVVAGDGDYMEPVRGLISRLGLEQDVYLTGRCSRVAELLAASDVCVLSSRSEGFSNSILEYMAAARPVVATDVGGAREAIVEGETGHLVPAGDDERMAARILSLLDDPARARRMGERGQTLVKRTFSCEAQLERTERLYQQLLAPFEPGIVKEAGMAERESV